MRIRNCLLAMVTSIGLVGTTTGLAGCAYCQEHPWVCVGGGVLIVGGIILAAANDPPDLPSPSDLRLKRDVTYAGTLENGVHVYSFRYWNDDRTFVGVVAQDLLEDPRFRHAVRVGEGGYYEADLRALNLKFAGPLEQFQAAGRRAVEGAIAAQ